MTELLGVRTSDVDVMMGTFTKSFGSVGGYIAGSSELVSSLRRHAAACLYAPAMSPPAAAQASADDDRSPARSAMPKLT